MPSTKTWTDDDRERALQWIERKAARALFRDQSGDLDSHLERIRQAAADLPDVLRAALTPEAWKALLNALRQRKHVANRTVAPKQMTVEGLLELDAKQAGVSVEEHMLRKVAEDMYWLNVMLARKINGGTTTTIQATVDQQEAAFSAWAHSFHEASGRASVRTEKTDGAVHVTVKPFSSAPIRVTLHVEVGGQNEPQPKTADKLAAARHTPQGHRPTQPHAPTGPTA